MTQEQTHIFLWQQMIKGDKNAFSSLFDVFGKELVNYAYKISLDKALAKDAVQDVFVDLWLYRMQLSEEVQVRFYLYRSVRRALSRLLKNEQSELATAQSTFHDLLADHASPEVIICDSETTLQQEKELEKSLLSLSEREREIVTLKYYANLKLKDIALMLDLKEQTVANTLQNALGKLRKQLRYLVSLLILLLIK